MMEMKNFFIFHLVCLILLVGICNCAWAEDKLIDASQLEMFVDELEDMPRIQAFDVVDGIPVPKHLHIGMYNKRWKFHRDIPPTPVFAYGTSRKSATVPGPTIQALHGVETYVKWKNYLHSRHILPVDHTIPTAKPHRRAGIPTVVHLHGSISEPQSDGHSTSWFTRGFKERGDSWKKKTYHYTNGQHPGTLWYHDHAMGFTRLNLLAGLIGTYVIRQPEVELPLGLPHGEEFDHPLVVFDRDFRANGSIYMPSIGNTDEHPHWQPEYFGNATIVNGKAWPHMTVRRRKYRFRIINASNARFFRFYFDNGLQFIHVGSDSAYHERPVTLKELLLAPSEIADVVVDFSKSKSGSAILCNNAPYPYPSGGDEDDVNQGNSSTNKVMKFIIQPLNEHEIDTSRVPKKLIEYPSPDVSSASTTTPRYITLLEYEKNDEPIHLYINGKTFEDPVTEIPKVGSTEVWNIINLTDDNHPLHIHLGLFVVLDQTTLEDPDMLADCMKKNNDAIKCNVESHKREKIAVPDHEKGWKNTFKMMNGTLTTILVRFSYIHSNESYPFDVTAEPGYAYHCHILDHEDNVMMRPLKFIH